MKGKGWANRGAWWGSPTSPYIVALRLASRKLALSVFAASYWQVDKSTLTDGGSFNRETPNTQDGAAVSLPANTETTRKLNQEAGEQLKDIR